MLAEADFWTIPEKPCLYSWELKERSGWKGRARNCRRVFSAFFWKPACQSGCQFTKRKISSVFLQDSLKEYPPWRVKSVASLAPEELTWQQDHSGSTRSQDCDKKLLRSPTEFLEGDQTLKRTHTMPELLAGYPRVLLWVPSGAINPISNGMSRVAPGCNICMLGSEPHARSGKLYSRMIWLQTCSAAKCVILKNQKDTKCLVSWDWHSAGLLGLSAQDLWVV